MMTQRREFLKSIAGWTAGALVPARLGVGGGAALLESGAPLGAWVPGTLEIHHLDTGRGNATLILGPDGTSFLIDAGEAHSAQKLMSPARPDASHRAGEWIARYVRRDLARVSQDSLNVLLITHLHGDHVGQVVDTSPQSARGNYRLTGASDVADVIRIDELIDRGWPEYDYPAYPVDPSALNYIALARDLARHGTRVQRARAGSMAQLRLRRNPTAFPEYNARILAVNGEVWTGSGESATKRFPSLTNLSPEALPSENMCCAAVRLQYGNFAYYTGGDLTCDTNYGRFPWHDIETPVAKAAGRVSVAVANHHGYFDACGPAAIRLLRPQVWVLPTWHASHPATSVLAALVREELYAGKRSVFATGMAQAALAVNDRFANSLANIEGHVVVRVAPGGRSFRVDVVNAADESDTVVAAFGPYSPQGD